MTSRLEDGERVLLDACCLINLYASGRMEEILTDLPYRFALSRYVAEKEVLYIRSTATSAPEKLDLERDTVENRLEILEPRGDRELAELVRFASVLDDGEASTCALATVRGDSVATDDRKALRVLAQWAPNVLVVQTPEILFEWCRRRQLKDSEVRELLTAVRDRARCFPRKGAPCFDWWWSHLE